MEISVERQFDHYASIIQNWLIKLGLHCFTLPDKMKIDLVKTNASDDHSKVVARTFFSVLSY